MKRLMAAACVAALAGCQSMPEVKPAPEVHAIEVPVIVPCLSVDQLPKRPKSAMDPKGDVKQLAAGAAIDILELEAYASRLRALLIGCAR